MEVLLPMMISQAVIAIATVAAIKTDVGWIKKGMESLDARLKVVESAK